MDYQSRIQLYVEMMVKAEMEQGKTYTEACNDVEDLLTEWIVVGENNAMTKEEDDEQYL